MPLQFTCMMLHPDSWRLCHLQRFRRFSCSIHILCLQSSMHKTSLNKKPPG